MQTTKQSPIPYAVQKSIRGYQAASRTAIAKRIQEWMDDHPASTPTACEIAGMVVEVVFGVGSYDEGMEQMCLEAYDAGKTTPLSQMINDLQLSGTRPAEVSDR